MTTLRLSALLTAALLGLAAPVWATSADEDNSFCAAIGQLAATIMTNRQHGVLMSTAMTANTGTGFGATMARLFIEDAYAELRYSTPEIQERVVLDFRIAKERMCYESRAQKPHKKGKR